MLLLTLSQGRQPWCNDIKQGRQSVMNFGAKLPSSSPTSPPFPLTLPSPSLPFPLSPPLSSLPSPLPLEVGPLNSARGLGERCKLPQQGLGWGRAQAEIEFGAF